MVGACDKFPQFLRRSENEVKKEYYKRDSNKEDLEAMYLAGKASCCGDDKFSDNDVEALNLFCKAAKQGHTASMLEVGKIYSHESSIKDTIIPYDRALAFTYFSMAEQGGYDKAELYKEEVLEGMSDQDFSRATRLIESFPVIPCGITR